VARLSGAYSSRYTAAPTPNGNVMSAMSNIRVIDPMSAGKIPASSGTGWGGLVRNCQSTHPIASTATYASNTASATIPSNVAPRVTYSKATSFARLTGSNDLESRVSVAIYLYSSL
jgi:hypothetical protein